MIVISLIVLAIIIIQSLLFFGIHMLFGDDYIIITCVVSFSMPIIFSILAYIIGSKIKQD